MLVEVILTKNAKAIDMAFTYAVPEEMTLDIGSKVIVPFGQGNRLTEGFVLQVVEHSDYEIKPIFQLVDGSLSKKQIEMIIYLRETYLCTYAEAITTVVPSGSKLVKHTEYTWLKPLEKSGSAKQKLLLTELTDMKTESELTELGLMNTVRNLMKKGYIHKHEYFKSEVNLQYKKIVTSLYEPEDLNFALAKVSRQAHKQIKTIEFIVEAGVCDWSILKQELKITKSILDKLEKLEIVSVTSVEKFRMPDSLKINQSHQKYPLSEAQKEIFDTLYNALYQHHKFLLHGVTGSGKTEIYMTIAEEVIKLNQQVIILVPEIALTPQIVAKFLKRFGQSIAVLHSKVSIGERFDQYRRIQNGQVNIVIGARSAIFAPCEKLGMIIIDESHEQTYKSDANPKYNTIEVAEHLCEKANVPLLIASATPSIQQYYETENNYKLLSLNERFNIQLPQVHLVDMREELMQGNKSMFSELLIEKIEDRLSKEEQVILFYNRKGYATFVSCRACGFALKCPRCDIALTYHHKNNEAKCSYCDYNIRVPSTCPECDSKYFKYFGAGTEKVEVMVQEAFPDARIGRLDSESTSKKGALEKIIDDVEKGNIDILLGTQMVTKGLDFKNVTLVGALSADMSLNLPDYRAPEKTFQLLTQVAGRAGRGEKLGEVVVQTYVPEHYAIQNAVTQDYLAFYKEELPLRSLFNYPPYYEMASIMVIGPSEDRTIKSIHNLHHELTRFIYKRIKPEQIEVLGPNPALFQKINNKYRWQIILKFGKMDMALIRNIIHYVCVHHRNKVVLDDVYINININPLSLL